jgi:hypothetical protein
VQSMKDKFQRCLILRISSSRLFHYFLNMNRNLKLLMNQVLQVRGRSGARGQQMVVKP